MKLIIHVHKNDVDKLYYYLHDQLKEIDDPPKIRYKLMNAFDFEYVQVMLSYADYKILTSHE